MATKPEGVEAGRRPVDAWHDEIVAGLYKQDAVCLCAEPVSRLQALSLFTVRVCECGGVVVNARHVKELVEDRLVSQLPALLAALRDGTHAHRAELAEMQACASQLESRLERLEPPAHPRPPGRVARRLRLAGKQPQQSASLL